MSRVSQLVEEIAARTSNLLRRAGEGFVTRYRAGSGGLRTTATGLTGADQRNTPKFTWDRASRIAWTNGSGSGRARRIVSHTGEDFAGFGSGWVDYSMGPKGSGYYAVREQKLINIDIAAKGDNLLLTDIMAHEAGYARKSDVPLSIRPPTKSMTREQWINEHLHNSFVDEAEAELTSAQVRREISENGGPDIRPFYSVSYASGTISRQEARLIIADSINHPHSFWYQEYYPFYQKLSDDYFGN